MESVSIGQNNMDSTTLQTTSCPAVGEKDDLLTLSKFAHDWVRHHQTMIMQVNTVGLSVSSAILTFALSQIEKTTETLVGLLFLVPSILAGLILVTTLFLIRLVKGGFKRIVQIEKTLGFFELRSSDGEFLLPPDLKGSGTRTWPHIVLFLVTNSFLMTSCLILAALFLFRWRFGG